MPDCPASTHNTATAATRGDRKVPGSPRCICPRALELRAEALKRRRYTEQTGLKMRHPNVTYAPGRPLLEQIPEGERWINAPRRPVRPPTFDRNVPCGTQGGQQLLERACSKEKNAVQARDVFIQACREQCPSYGGQEGCLAWILNSEEPAGSWGQIYGGLTVNDRKRVAKERKQTQGAGDHDRAGAGEGTTGRRRPNRASIPTRAYRG